jgi:xylulokinase
VAVPENEEAACLGAAMIGAVAAGDFGSFEEAVKRCVSIRDEFSPSPSSRLDEKYQTFEKLYESLLPVFTASGNR